MNSRIRVPVKDRPEDQGIEERIILYDRSRCTFCIQEYRQDMPRGPFNEVGKHHGEIRDIETLKKEYTLLTKGDKLDEKTLSEVKKTLNNIRLSKKRSI